MVHLVKCDNPISLSNLADQIRKSSNFRFSWQFYQCSGINPQSPASIRQALEAIIANPELHYFLRQSFIPMYTEAFEIEPLHEHSRVVATAGEFENILAQAASDHLGAYSQRICNATVVEKQVIKDLFGRLGDYRTYELLPGGVAGCRECGNHNNHLFSSWFFDVAWDWCLFAFWPHCNLLWIGCLTDTD
ncbi:MAG: hypothetical protein U0796_10435 [Gemmatales bacterium]